jgi:hypothetical protein
VLIHQIVNLEFENVKGTQGSRKGREYEPAKKYGEATDEVSKSTAIPVNSSADPVLTFDSQLCLPLTAPYCSTTNW